MVSANVCYHTVSLVVCVYVVDWWARFDATKIVIGFSNGYFVVISTNKDDIGQVMSAFVSVVCAYVCVRRVCVF